jgi:tripartite-type tricarboxylate transporter receptor subunit TctC
MQRRTLLAAPWAVFAAGFVGASRADPVRRIVLGFPAGASGDAIARVLADKMSAILAQAVIVEDHPGADGRMALEQVRKAAPDGMTLVFTPLTPLTSAPWLYKLSYDPFQDFQPLVHVASFKHVLVVGAGVPAASLAEYVALARKHPVMCFYSATSAGSAAHMAMTEFALRLQLDLRFVPYKGTANALTDVLGGRLAAFVGNVADVAELGRQGRVRLLAVASGERSRHLPDVPTFREQGFDIEAGGSFGLYAPAKTPPAVAEMLTSAALEALRDATVHRLIDKLGLEVTGYGPAMLAQVQRADYERSGRRIRASGFKIDP